MEDCLNTNVVASLLMMTALPVIAETITFDQEAVGAVPDGWVSGVTGKGASRWAIETDPTAPSPPNVLKQSGAGAFPWCVTPVAGNQWHTLRVEFAGKHIRVSLDGKRYIEIDDERITGSGAVGVWTRADSITAFDDFTYGATAPR